MSDETTPPMNQDEAAVGHVIHWWKSVVIHENRVRRVGTLYLTDWGVVFIQMGSESREGGQMFAAGGLYGAILSVEPILWALRWITGKNRLESVAESLDTPEDSEPEDLEHWYRQSPGSFRVPWHQITAYRRRWNGRVQLETTLDDRYRIAAGKSGPELLGKLAVLGEAAASRSGR